MWVDSQGRLCTAAMPVAAVLSEVPQARLSDTILRRLAEFDPWREGGIVDQIESDMALEPELWTPGSADEFVGQPVPADVLTSIDWAGISGISSAEDSLAKVPTRWRLDAAQLMEDLTDLLEDA